MIIPDKYINEHAGVNYFKKTRSLLSKEDFGFYDHLVRCWLTDCGGIRNRKFVQIKDGDIVEHSALSYPEMMKRVLSVVFGEVLLAEDGYVICSIYSAKEPEVIDSAYHSQGWI